MVQGVPLTTGKMSGGGGGGDGRAPTGRGRRLHETRLVYERRRGREHDGRHRGGEELRGGGDRERLGEQGRRREDERGGGGGGGGGAGRGGDVFGLGGDDGGARQGGVGLEHLKVWSLCEHVRVGESLWGILRGVRYA